MNDALWIVGEVLRDVRAWIAYERSLARPHGERLMKLETIADRMKRLALMVGDVNMDGGKMREMATWRDGSCGVVLVEGESGQRWLSACGPGCEWDGPHDLRTAGWILLGWLPIGDTEPVELTSAPDYSLFDRLYGWYLTGGDIEARFAAARAAKECAFVGADFRAVRGDGGER